MQPLIPRVPSRGLLLGLICLLSGPQAQAALKNQLIDHSSPYLAMHGRDPVHWQQWGATALERARKENKLLFVSSGYFSCHWCHVMQRESYQNPQIAALLNQRFIPVKIDRELEPALDAYLIDFVERIRSLAGWPLNVFLTPEGHPLFGLTYSPPQEFSTLLERMATRWDADQAALQELARNAALALHHGDAKVPNGDEPVPGLGLRLEAKLVSQALRLADRLAGGFGEQSKFPMEPQLSALLTVLAHQQNQELASFLRLTLEKMASQGLQDHIGGGFFRYTVDPAWQTPHFEKMLYTNTLLAQVYLQAGPVLQEPKFSEVARQTLDFMLSVLASPNGGFISSLSAVDGQGVEGGYYLWNTAELTQLLEEQELALAQARWGLWGPPPFSTGYLPTQSVAVADLAIRFGASQDQIHEQLASIRNTLHNARAKRDLPRDIKRLAGWNGLVLSALAQGAKAFDNPCYQNAARSLHDWLLAQLWNGTRLKRTPEGSGAASLEDYAYVLQGLMDWMESQGDQRDITTVREILAQAWKRFHSEKGWRLGEELLIPADPAKALLPDGPMPSPSAVLIGVTLKVTRKSDDLSSLRDQALTALYADRERLESRPFLYPTQIVEMAAQDRQAD